jgi:hypothetical protein
MGRCVVIISQTMDAKEIAQGNPKDFKLSPFGMIPMDVVDSFIPGDITPIQIGAPRVSVYSAALSVKCIFGFLSQAKEKLSDRGDAEVVKLIPHHFDDVQNAALYNWGDAGIDPEDADDRADEINYALSSVVLLLTRELESVLIDKLWEDQYTLSLRGFDVRCEIWDIRFSSENWGYRRMLIELDLERNRLQRLAQFVVDPDLQSLMAEQAAHLAALEINAAAEKPSTWGYDKPLTDCCGLTPNS